MEENKKSGGGDVRAKALSWDDEWDKAMSKAIHITTARTMLNSGDPVDISVWKANGEILHLHNCISLRYEFYAGTRNIKLLTSGQIRKIRDCCIFNVNGLEVFL